jgi:hypothetical protein
MERDKFLSTLPLCFIFLVLPFALRLLQRFVGRHRFQDNPQRDLLISWDVTADQISISNHLGRTEFRWDAVVKVVRVSDGFLVSTQTTLFQWLPLHAFHEPADAQRFADLAESKVKNYRDRS